MATQIINLQFQISDFLENLQTQQRDFEKRQQDLEINDDMHHDNFEYPYIQISEEAETIGGYLALNQHIKAQANLLSPMEKMLWMSCLHRLSRPRSKEAVAKTLGFFEEKPPKTVAVIGDSGTGKTMALRLFASEENLPYVSLPSDKDQTEARIAWALRQYLQKNNSLEAAPTFESLSESLHENPMGCIILDEFTHLHKFPRAWARTFVIVSISPMTKLHPRKRIYFQPYTDRYLTAFLDLLDLLLPMSSLSGLSERPMMSLIEAKTKGNVRQIMYLISKATERAIIRGFPTLTLELLLEITRESRMK